MIPPGGIQEAVYDIPLSSIQDIGLGGDTLPLSQSSVGRPFSSRPSSISDEEIPVPKYSQVPTSSQPAIEYVDLRIPPKSGIPGDLSTIGDIHANAVLLLYYLCSKGYVKIEDDDYRAFYKFVCGDFCANPLTSKERVEFDTFVKKRVRFDQLYNREWIILIGDEVGDRGPLDYFISRILKAMDRNGLDYDIVISNHGIEYMWSSENNYEANRVNRLKEDYLESYFKRFGRESENLFKTRYTFHLDDRKIGILADGKTPWEPWTQARSLFANIRTGKSLAGFNERCKGIYEDFYKKHISVLQYRISDDDSCGITVYMHAPVGVETFVKIFDYLKKRYKEYQNDQFVYNGTREQFKESIDKINEMFRFLILQPNWFPDLFFPSWDDEGKETESPLFTICWERHGKKDWDKAFDAQFSDDCKYKTSFGLLLIHGHDGNGRVYPQLKGMVLNLDNSLKGTDPGSEQGILRTVDWFNPLKFSLSESSDSTQDLTAAAAADV